MLSELGPVNKFACISESCIPVKPFNCSSAVNGVSRQIPGHWVCDGQNDCLDTPSSDEANCSSGQVTF
jgi:hypothetical protein